MGSSMSLLAMVIIVYVLPDPWVCQMSPLRFVGSAQRTSERSTARIWCGLRITF